MTEPAYRGIGYVVMKPVNLADAASAGIPAELHEPEDRAASCIGCGTRGKGKESSAEDVAQPQAHARHCHMGFVK